VPSPFRRPGFAALRPFFGRPALIGEMKPCDPSPMKFWQAPSAGGAWGPRPDLVDLNLSRESRVCDVVPPR